ncbi:MAG: ABC transporter permease [Chloroflexota bacterium]|nr:ABC transporter permease [Chloroflexota bacterium]
MSASSTPRRHLLPFGIRMERRLETPRGLGIVTTIGAVVVALLISALLIWLIGGDPVNAYAHIVRSSLGSVGVLSDTLVKATPLIFTGLACSVAFRMRLWNIGAEGQLMMGAWGASAVVLVGVLPEGTPGLVYLPLMMIAGIAAGALWAGIAGWLKARLNVNEIITTLMMVYIAIKWVQFWVFGPWSDGGFQMSPRFPREAWLPRLTDYSSSVPDFGGLTVHLGFILAIVAAGLVWVFLNRTRKGYEIRLIGDNPRAARYAGIDIGRTIILVMLVSGALAGLAGATEISGVVHRLQDNFSPGYGFTGIIVAFLARFNPLGVIVAAIAFGALILAGREIQPAGIPAMIQGIILFCVIASDVFLRYRVRVVRR